jgi:regulator of RNase E activity RraA
MPDDKPADALKATLGKLPSHAIGMVRLPSIAAATLDGFRALPDLTGMTSDAMDLLGIAGSAPASVLRPTDSSARIVGRALTVRNLPSSISVADAVAGGVSQMAEIEAHHLAEPGDVLVVQGVDGVSNMGGLSATTGHRQGEIGAIVDGGVRDIGQSRSIGYPIWSRSVSPITGKWRVRTVAVNVAVTICGVTVEPGDIVLADEVGVCFVPLARADEVLALASGIRTKEQQRQDRLEAIGAGNEFALAAATRKGTP